MGPFLRRAAALYCGTVMLSLVLTAFLLLCPASTSPAQARFPGREVAAAPGEVRDSFLGYFIGLVTADATGWADSEYLHEVLPEFTAFLSLSFEEIRRVERRRSEEGTFVSVDFASGLELPIPFKVLWDTPGTVYGARSMVYREALVSEARIRGEGKGELTLAPLYVYDRVSGGFAIDFDPWIDVLLGRAVDDVEITRALLFRLDGVWYGALMGKGYDGQLVIGYFDFRQNRILLPMPRRLRGIGEVYGID